MNTPPLHVIMLSTDRTLFDPGSPARKRMEEYARAFGRLSVIVFAKRSLGAVPVVGIPLSLYPTNSHSRFGYVRDAVRVGSTIENADVISTQDPFETGLAGKRIARALRIPLHVQVHTDFLVPAFARAHWPWNLIRLYIARRVLKRAARIRVVSERIKAQLVAAYHPRADVSVLPIYADMSSFEHMPHEPHPRFTTAFLVVSRLEKEKRINETIRALKAVRDTGVNAGLDIVGSGSEEGHLKKLAATLGVSEHVVFHGFQNETARYYAHADALLYPGAPYEGFGMAIVEALSAGVPVVAHDVGVAREAGAVIAGDTEIDFSNAVVDLARHIPAERPHLLLWKPYTHKEEYLQKLKEDVTIPNV